MANTIGWGQGTINNTNGWGKGASNNSISWGSIYGNSPSGETNIIGGLQPTFELKYDLISTDFTFTRNSFATRVNEFGLIETVTNLGSNLVQNGSFDELGSERVVNGDFENGTTNWQNPTYGGNNSATLSIDNGSLKVEKNADLDWRSSFVNQTPLTFTDGKTYKITYSLKDGNTSGSDVYIRTNFDRSASTVNIKALTNDWVEYTDYYVADSSAEDISFGVLAWQNAGNGQYYFIDNVSVKQVDPNDDWSFSNVGGSNGWRIADGRAICDTVNPLSGRNLDSTTVLTSGKTYKLTLDILQSADGMQVYVGATLLSTLLPTGTNLGYEYIINGDDHTGGIFRLYAGSSDLQEIDNVSIQEVIEDDIPRIDYTGSTFDVPVLGSELVVNGDFATDSDWNTLNTTISGGKGNLDGDGQTSLLWQDILTNGKSYKATFTVSDYNGLGEARVINTSGAPMYIITSNGTFTTYFTHSLADGDFLFRARLGAIYSVDNVSVKEVTAYTTTDKGAFLLEPISTNLIDYSEDIEGSNWTTSGIATTTDVTTSPDGTQNADLIDSVSNGSCFISDSTLTFTIGNTYTFSVFAKKGNNDWIRTAHVSSATNASWFDLENGVVGTVNGVSGTIEDFGNGWYKCTNTFVATQATGGNQVFIGICDANGSTDAGASGQNDYVWGMQVEELSYATSYIPTSSTTVTRAQESCIDATPTINSEEGVLYGELSVPAADTFVLIALGNSSANNDQNSVTIGFDNGVDFYGRVKSPSGSFVSQSVDAPINTNYKIALRYEQNNCALFVDGVKIASSSINYLFALPLDNLSFNYNTNNGLPFYGRTKDLRIYDKALTDDELINLTTI